MILDSLCDLKCKTSHSRNLEIGTLGKAPPCCSRTRHKFEATKCQSHHTWQMCLPNSPSETSSHLVMMSHVSWVSHSKSPMMYPRCPESRYKKEEYPVTYHCHLHVPGFSWKSCSHHFFTKLHSNINISFKLPRFQKKNRVPRLVLMGDSTALWRWTNLAKVFPSKVPTEKRRKSQPRSPPQPRIWKSPSNGASMILEGTVPQR